MDRKLMSIGVIWMLIGSALWLFGCTGSACTVNYIPYAVILLIIGIIIAIFALIKKPKN